MCWHYNLNAFQVMEQHIGNCGASANLANYLLEGDYDELGVILHAYYPGNGGGHVYNYILYESKYYIVDFSWYIFGRYDPNNDFPVLVLDKLEDYGKQFDRLYGGVCLVLRHTTPGQHLPNVFDDENRQYIIPDDAAYKVLYQSEEPDAYHLATVPVPKDVPDWHTFG